MYVRLIWVQNRCSERIFGVFGGKKMNMNRHSELSRSELRELKIRRNRIKRQRQLRRRLVIGAASLIIIVCSSLGLTSFLSKAAEEPDAYKTKVYSSVMVPFGSGLTEVASEYVDLDYYESCDAYIAEVKFINHLSDDEDVRPGHYLIVPRYTDPD